MSLWEFALTTILIGVMVVVGVDGAFRWKADYDYRRATWNVDYIFEYVRDMKTQSDGKDVYDDFGEEGEGRAWLPDWWFEPLKLSRETASPRLLGGVPGYVLEVSRTCAGCRDLHGSPCGTRDSGLDADAYPRSGRYFFLTITGPADDPEESLLDLIHSRVRDEGWTPVCWDPETACSSFDEDRKVLVIGWERWESLPPASASYEGCSAERLLAR